MKLTISEYLARDEMNSAHKVIIQRPILSAFVALPV